MNKTTILILLALLSISLFSIYVLAVPTVTIGTPTAGQTVNGTVVRLNITIAKSATDSNITNVTWYYRSSATGSWTVIGRNATAGNGRDGPENMTNYTIAWDTSSLSDGTAYTINVTVGNGTLLKECGVANSGCGSATVAINVDNTDPIAVLDAQAKAYKNKNLPYRCDSSTDGVDTSLTYAVFLQKSDGTFLTTKTSSTGEFISTDLDLVGQYNLGCTVTDNVFKVNSDNETVTVVSDGAGDVIIPPSSTIITDNLALILILVGVFIAIVGGLFVVIMMRKK